MDIIIAVRELGCGGTEIAMLNFIKELNKFPVNLTLLLVKKRGSLVNSLPDNIEIIEMPFKKECDRYFICDDISLQTNHVKRIYVKIIRKLIRGIDKIAKKINWKVDIYNTFITKKTIPLQKKYDLAIDFYGYGITNSKYIADNITADNKVMWIHDERLLPISRSRSEFKKYNHFYGVSKACVNAFTSEFPETRGRVSVFYNIIDKKNIEKRSLEDIEDIFTNKGVNIVSVGRLEWQKGFDVAIKAAKILKNIGCSFRWIIVGDGSEKNKLLKQIKSENLENDIILVGRKDNPYPYMYKADIYVQTSRHEGYGLTIAEAKILKKPIIATKLPCIEEQITDMINGILVEFDESRFADAIARLIKEQSIRERFIKNLNDEEMICSKGIKEFLVKWGMTNE